MNEVSIDILTRDLLDEQFDAIQSIDRLVDARLIEPWSREQFFLELPGKWTCSLLARDPSGVVGYAFRSLKGNRVHGHRMVVRPDARRHGVGKLLFAETVRIAVEHGVGEVTWKIAACNDPAQAFFRALGGEAYGTEGSRLLFRYRCASLAKGA
jgi:ribosomal protein S18 acetylase RimI-like enzyme